MGFAYPAGAPWRRGLGGSWASFFRSWALLGRFLGDVFSHLRSKSRFEPIFSDFGSIFGGFGVVWGGFGEGFFDAFSHYH